jgi:hypothetical protein
MIKNVLYSSALVLLGWMAPVAAADVEIELQLPKAFFVGTPKDLKTENLEKPKDLAAKITFKAPEGTKNVALEKPVTSSDPEPFIGKLNQVNDGKKEASEDSYVEMWKGLQHVQVDLGATHSIYAIALWHFHIDPRIYRDVVIQIADDKDFISNVQTVFNNDHDNSAGLGIGKDYEYIETFQGKLVDAKGIKGRYVRLYTNGSTSSDMNHITEVEVYGLPAK